MIQITAQLDVIVQPCEKEILVEHPGEPGGAHGNVTTNWDLSGPDHPNPEYR